MVNLDRFSYIGLFSVGNIPLSQIENRAAFKKQVKTVFFGNGQPERGTDTSKVAIDVFGIRVAAIACCTP
jgi:hypothetical protein